MRKMLTVFPKAENVHLIKDVGMIPYILHKELDYEATLVCYKNDRFTYLTTEVKGLQMAFISKLFGSEFCDVLWFLLQHAGKYDLLQTYHVGRSTLLWSFVFKVLTGGKGKTYLKLDADDGILRFKPSKTTKYLLQQLDLVTVENSYYAQQLNAKQQLGREVLTSPNGFYDDGIQHDIDFEQKQDKIITVGRIGTTQKATETLCKAFAEFAKHQPTWELVIIGPVAANFEAFIATYFGMYPELKRRVTFTGAIVDREALAMHYRSAKIFVLTSRYEGFPIVLTEAAKFGCYLISTDLPPVQDLTRKGEYGSIFPIDDHAALSQLLLSVCANNNRLATKARAMRAFAYQNFYWPTICRNLDQWLWK